jgi:hypothetical protein
VVRVSKRGCGISTAFSAMQSQELFSSESDVEKEVIFFLRWGDLGFDTASGMV